MINYLSVYRKLIIEISKTEEVDIHHLYICLKYHYLFCDGQFEEFNTLYSLYLQKSISMRDPKFEILLIKVNFNEAVGIVLCKYGLSPYLQCTMPTLFISRK